MSVGSNPAFPNMYIPYELNSYVINHVNIAISRKLLKITIKFSVKIIKLVHTLHRLGVIKSFRLSKRNKNYYITLSPFFYKSSTYFSKVKLVSTSSKKFYISYWALRFVDKSVGNSIYVLSTSKGLLTHKECMKFKIGGVLLFLVLS